MRRGPAGKRARSVVTSTGTAPMRIAWGEKPGGRQVTPGGQQNVDDLPMLVDCPAEIGRLPATFR